MNDANMLEGSFAQLSGPLLFAHRGARLERPENTLPAFERALELGADVLELDVHATRDGQVVVCHDPDLLRVAGAHYRIRDLTLAELTRVALRDPGTGGTWRDWDGSNARVPTLGEVLEALPRALFNVDIKHPQALQAALSVVEQARASERVLFTSFSSSVTLRLTAARYAGPRGLGREEVMLAVLAAKLLPRAALSRFRLRGRRIQIPTRASGLELDRRELISGFHQLGLLVDYWVINDIGDSRRLLELGADGIITDDPRAIAECFRNSPETAAWRRRHAPT